MRINRLETEENTFKELGASPSGAELAPARPRGSILF